MREISRTELAGIVVKHALDKGSNYARSAAFETAEDALEGRTRETQTRAGVLKASLLAPGKDAFRDVVHQLASERSTKLTEVRPRFEAFSALSVKIAIKTRGKIIFICPQEVSAVEAQGNYVLLRRQSDTYLLKESISGIEEKLRQYGFLRIHRSALVNRAWVEAIRPWITGEYLLRIRGGREYKVSRTYRRNLKGLAQSWIGTDSFVD
jgi:DNA-binding LytR/AlgR family response regulator